MDTWRCIPLSKRVRANDWFFWRISAMAWQLPMKIGMFSLCRKMTWTRFMHWDSDTDTVSLTSCNWGWEELSVFSIRATAAFMTLAPFLYQTIKRNGNGHYNMRICSRNRAAVTNIMITGWYLKPFRNLIFILTNLGKTSASDFYQFLPLFIPTMFL